MGATNVARSQACPDPMDTFASALILIALSFSNSTPYPCHIIMCSSSCFEWIKTELLYSHALVYDTTNIWAGCAEDLKVKNLSYTFFFSALEIHYLDPDERGPLCI